MENQGSPFSKWNFMTRNAAGVVALVGSALGAMALGLRLVVARSDGGLVPGAVLALACAAAACVTPFFGKSFFVARRWWWVATAAWVGTWMWGAGPGSSEFWSDVQKLASFWALCASTFASLLLATRPMAATLGVVRLEDLKELSWATLWQQFLNRRELSQEPEWARVASEARTLFPAEFAQALAQWTWFKDAVGDLGPGSDAEPSKSEVSQDFSWLQVAVGLGAFVVWMSAASLSPTGTWFTRVESADEHARRTKPPEFYWIWRVERGNGTTYYEVPQEHLIPAVVEEMARRASSALAGSDANKNDLVVRRYVDLRNRWMGLTADGKAPTESTEHESAKRARLEKVVVDWFKLPPREQLLFWVGLAYTEVAWDTVESGAWGTPGEKLQSVMAVLKRELCATVDRFKTDAASNADAAFWLQQLPHANWYHLLDYMKIGTCQGLPPLKPVVKW